MLEVYEVEVLLMEVVINIGCCILAVGLLVPPVLGTYLIWKRWDKPKNCKNIFGWDIIRKE